MLMYPPSILKVWLKVVSLEPLVCVPPQYVNPSYQILGLVRHTDTINLKLERAFTLIIEGVVNVNLSDDPEVPIAVRKSRLKAPKTLNKITGKETATEHSFSVMKWGPKTAAFVLGAKKKGVEATCLTASMAYKQLKKPVLDKCSSGDSFGIEMDDRADVW